MSKLINFILSLFLVSSCGKAEDHFAPEDPSEDQFADYRNLSETIARDFTHGGFSVVSRSPEGSPVHQGEGLIWGGTYLWAAPCDVGSEVSRSMAAMILKNNGQLIRVDPLGEYEDGREVTLDGAIGLMAGVARRVVNCGESDLWRDPWDKMIKFQNANGGKLHANVEATMVDQWKYLRDLIGYKLGISSEPGDHRLKDLENAIGHWALLVKTAKETGIGSSACFRINLGFTSIITAETLGKSISSAGRDFFCRNVSGMTIPTTLHWCGYLTIKEYINEFEPDIWEYRHQRCQWENPDGKDNRSPALDKLVAYVMAHGWTNLQ
jgi:hypothetical protein